MFSALLRTVIRAYARETGRTNWHSSLIVYVQSSAVSAPAASAPAAAKAAAPAPAAAPQAPVKVSELRGTTVPFNGMQLAVSKNMIESLKVRPPDPWAFVSRSEPAVDG